MGEGARVRIGVQLPVQPAATLRTLARRIEALGFDAIWSGDHLQFHVPYLESLTHLAHLAAITERVQLGTCVYLLALRPAAWAAKQVATVDYLSGGRFIFGVGVGGEFPREFEAAGVPHAERGRRVDEALEVCRLLWSKSSVSYAGRFARFTEVSLDPKPVQPGGPPVWIGGRSDHALRRAARLGDGWVSYLVTPARHRESLEKIRALAAESGRRVQPGQGFEPAHLAFTVVDDDLGRARHAAIRDLTRQYDQPFDQLVDRYCVMGPPDRCIEGLRRYVEAGARTLVVSFRAGFDRVPEQVERFAADVLPHVRHA